ncbi:hypothetical protein [Singulisphaera sp. PoT]|uniref:hypothetical protein n=1 Tax=Singulisphaera sp. PoT TaxID=3411797 RepID=UPI003BF4D922
MAVDPLIIPIAAVFVPIVIVPTALAFRYFKYSRELKHRERMMALEMGRRLPEDKDPRTSAAQVSTAIGVGVPAVAFGSTWLVAQGGIIRDSEAIGLMWFAATALSVYSVRSAYKLAKTTFGESRPHSMMDVSDFAKSELEDADAYDVAGSRG